MRKGNPVESSNSVPFFERVKLAFDRYEQAGRRSNYEQAEDDFRILQEQQDLKSSVERLKLKRGRRYEDCSFDNYKIECDAQQTVVDALKAYSKQPNGRNVILFGSKGTGKDHLLMALAREVAKLQGLCVSWKNGTELHEEFRNDACGKITHNSLFDANICTTPILWVSDPLPPSGSLSEFQQAAWFGLVDNRYNNLLPCWISLNVVDGAEAESRMGAQAVDRLRHGALSLKCYWESFRTRQTDDQS